MIRRVSTKRAKRRRAQQKLRAQLAQERGAFCELRISGVCTRYHEGLHHIRKQSHGGADTPENCLLACNPCNVWVEDHPAEAWERGLVKKSWE